jgi:hypothetical protein
MLSTTGESEVYCDGLHVTIEEEKYELIQTDNSAHTMFRTEFAGTVITGQLNAEKFSCTTLNKNLAELRQTGAQKKARYPPAISYIHDKTKLGVIIGSIIRIETQNTTERDLLRSEQEMLFEMSIIGYQKEFLKKALFRVRKKKSWKSRATQLLKYIDEIQ